MRKFGYLAMWTLIDAAIASLVSYTSDLKFILVLWILIIGFLLGTMQEFVGNDLGILNQKKR